MTYPPLLQEIMVAVATRADVKALDVLDAAQVVDRAATAFGADRRRVWWWETLGKETYAVQYGSDVPFPKIREFFRGRGDRFHLAVTNDRPPPWLVLQGSLDSLLYVISECRFFEYFIVDEAFSLIVFDNHHNYLVFGEA